MQSSSVVYFENTLTEALKASLTPIPVVQESDDEDVEEELVSLQPGHCDDAISEDEDSVKSDDDDDYDVLR